MPSKHSHALVLSHYGSQGLINHDVSMTKAGSRSSIISTMSTPVRSTHQPKRADTAQVLRSSLATPQPSSSPRVRLGTSTPYTRIEVSPPPLHRKTSSVETQISAPPSSPPTRHHQTPSYIEIRPHTPKHQASVETQIYDSQSPRSPPSRTNVTDWSRSSEVKARRRAAQVSSPNRFRPGSRNKLSKEFGNKAPQKPHTPPLTYVSQSDVSIEAKGFIPSQPPSPPATPDSGKSFGFETYLDRIDNDHNDKKTSLASTATGSPKTINLEASSDRLEDNAPRKHEALSGHSEPSSESLVILPRITPDSGKSFGLKNHSRISESTRPAPPVPVPERSVRHSLPKSPPSEQRTISQPPPLQPNPSETKDSRAYHSPTFSMTPQPSSRGSVASPTFDFRPEPLKPKKAASLHSPTLSITVPPIPLNPEPSRPRTPRSAHGSRFSFSTRRSPLNFASAPPDLDRASGMPSETFFDDDADLESLPSEMDFDSLPWTDLNAEPTLFGKGRAGDKRWSVSSRASSYDSAAPPPIRRAPNYTMLSEKPVPKTPRPSFPSSLFARSSPPPPKAVLYSETMPGPPPIPVPVLGKSIALNSVLYPATPARYQPQHMSEEREGRRMSGASSVPYAPPRRGVSQGAPERRGPWFRSKADRAYGHG